MLSDGCGLCHVSHADQYVSGEVEMVIPEARKRPAHHRIPSRICHWDTQSA